MRFLVAGAGSWGTAFTHVLLERGLNAVPVIDEEGAAIGVLSKTDLLRYQEAEAGAGEPFDFLRVREPRAPGRRQFAVEQVGLLAGLGEQVGVVAVEVGVVALLAADALVGVDRGRVAFVL